MADFFSNSTIIIFVSGLKTLMGKSKERNSSASNWAFLWSSSNLLNHEGSKAVNPNDAIIPAGTRLENLGSILDKYEMEFSEIHNRTVESQLRPKELYFRATKSYCDCDTVLGSLNRNQEYQ